MKRFLGLLCAVGVLAGCASTYTDPYYYDAAYYDSYYYGYDSSYVYGWYDPYGVYYFASTTQPQTAPIDLNAAATSIAARAPDFFTPAGCVNATASGATVTYVLSNCTGQYETRTINGTVMVTLSQSNGALVFTGTSTDLTVDGQPFILDLTASAVSAGTQRTVTIDSRSRAPDQTDSRQSRGTLTWTQGSGCTELNAQGTSTRGGQTANTTITGLQRCAGQCPTAGTVTVEGPDETFTSTFNGDGTMVVTSSGGDSTNYDLQCQ